MHTIYKYPLKVTDEQVVRTYKNARILSCQAQSGNLCLWALVDTDQEKEDLRIRIYGTGHIVDKPSLPHIGTVQVGPFVWHVFLDN